MRQDKSINQVAYTIALLAIITIGNLIVILLNEDIMYILIAVGLAVLLGTTWRRRKAEIRVDERVEAITNKSASNALLIALVIFHAIAFELDSEGAKLVLGGITIAILVFAISLLIYNKKADLTGEGK